MTQAQRPTLERLVGTLGDVPQPSPLPELVGEHAARFERLWAWYERMKAEHPIVVKGKRLPKA